MIKCTQPLLSTHPGLLRRGEVVVVGASGTVDGAAMRGSANRHQGVKASRHRVWGGGEKAPCLAGVRLGGVDVAITGSIHGSPLSLTKEKAAASVEKDENVNPGMSDCVEVDQVGVVTRDEAGEEVRR